MMRVIPGGAGEIVGEKIIYVDSPEIRQKYEEALLEKELYFNQILTGNSHTINELMKDLDRKEHQIEQYVKAINQNVIPFPVKESPKEAASQLYIGKLKAELEAQLKKRQELEELLHNRKPEIKIVEVEKPVVKSIEPLVPEYKINWLHVATVAVPLLVMAYLLGRIWHG